MSNELKIGLTVLVAFTVAYIGFRFMSDVPVFRQPQEVVSTFERVDGLATGGLVYMNGVKIGSVKKVELTPEMVVRVTMSIEVDVPIPSDSRAMLTSSGLLDGKSIVIERGQSSEPIADGGSIEGVFVDSMLETLGERGQVLGDDISGSLNEMNRFLGQLNRALDDSSSRALNASLIHLEEATSVVSRTLQAKQQEMEQSVESLHSLLSELDSTAVNSRPHLEAMIRNLEGTSRDLGELTVEMDTTVVQLNQILTKVNRGEGSLGRLVNDASLYENSDSLSVELRDLIKAFREDPGQFLRHMSLIEVF